MKTIRIRFRYIPFFLLLVLFVIHNALVPNSAFATKVVYSIYFITAFISLVLTYRNCYVDGKRIATEKKFSKKRQKMALFALNIIIIPLTLFVGFIGLEFASDIYNGRVVNGVFYIQQNLENLTGAWAMQQLDVKDETHNDEHLTFLLRSQYIRVGQMYRIQYAEQSGFVLTAIKLESTSPK